MESIEKNLYDFYRFIGSASSVEYFATESHELVRAEKNNWPQIRFNLSRSMDAERLIPELAKEITENKNTPFFIAPENLISRKHAPVLKANGIMPVKVLRGMNRPSRPPATVKLPGNTRIHELHKKEQLTHFTGLVNQELMATDRPLDPGLLAEVPVGIELKIYGLIHQHTLVSTTLVFKQGQIAGLYFIATKKEYQNKGFASALIHFILNELVDDGIDDVVLHANNLATGLYEKLGFTHQNNFIIYKKR